MAHAEPRSCLATADTWEAPGQPPHPTVMDVTRPKTACFLASLWFGSVIALCSLSLAQQPAATGPPLVIRTTSLPKTYLKQAYEAHLQAEGGINPLKWELTDGRLPAGIALQADGRLSGAATETGTFHFTATVTDSDKPAHQRQQQLSLVVVAPLLARWGQYPTIRGRRIEGSIFVSNQTEQDFDLTAIVLAVNEIGRATAIGYQHFRLQKNSEEVEIPFGDNLAGGDYQVSADVVAEVEATNTIYRVRLAPKDAFHLETGP